MADSLQDIYGSQTADKNAERFAPRDNQTLPGQTEDPFAPEEEGAHPPPRPRPAPHPMMPPGWHPPMAPPAPPPEPPPFTQADSLQVQRLHQALSAAAQQVSDGILTPEEGQQFQNQIQQRLKPLTQRQQQQQQQQEQEGVQKALHQQAIAQSIQQQNAAFQAQHFAQGVAMYMDPATGRTAHYVQSKPGHWEEIKFEAHNEEEGRLHDMAMKPPMATGSSAPPQIAARIPLGNRSSQVAGDVGGDVKDLMQAEKERQDALRGTVKTGGEAGENKGAPYSEPGDGKGPGESTPYQPGQPQESPPLPPGTVSLDEYAKKFTGGAAGAAEAAQPRPENTPQTTIPTAGNSEAEQQQREHMARGGGPLPGGASGQQGQQFPAPKILNQFGQEIQPKQPEQPDPNQPPIAEFYRRAQQAVPPPRLHGSPHQQQQQLQHYHDTIASLVGHQSNHWQRRKDYEAHVALASKEHGRQEDVRQAEHVRAEQAKMEENMRKEMERQEKKKADADELTQKQTTEGIRHYRGILSKKRDAWLKDDKTKEQPLPDSLKEGNEAQEAARLHQEDVDHGNKIRHPAKPPTKEEAAQMQQLGAGAGAAATNPVTPAGKGAPATPFGTGKPEPEGEDTSWHPNAWIPDTQPGISHSPERFEQLKQSYPFAFGPSGADKDRVKTMLDAVRSAQNDPQWTWNQKLASVMKGVAGVRDPFATLSEMEGILDAAHKRGNGMTRWEAHNYLKLKARLPKSDMDHMLMVSPKKD